MTAEERFLDKISPEPNTGCWLWDAGLKPAGYGSFHVAGKTVLAHRYGYQMFKGEIPEGKQLDHICRVRSCVNPDHLEPVTCKENIRRGNTSIHNWSKTHCKNGHSLSGENLYKYTTKEGWNVRQCLICKRAAKARFDAKPKN